jgi:hypothetical protein
MSGTFNAMNKQRRNDKQWFTKQHRKKRRIQIKTGVNSCALFSLAISQHIFHNDTTYHEGRV